MLLSMSLGPKTEQVLTCLLNDACESSSAPIDAPHSIHILRQIFSSCDALTCFAYKLLLYGLEWCPWVLTGHFRPGRFTRSSKETRSAHINAMRTSRLYVRRALFKAMLTPVWISHYTRTEAQLALGYDSAQLSTIYQRTARHD